jgi:predicted DNA-binding protein YlxM (UPF0122 family)
LSKKTQKSTDPNQLQVNNACRERIDILRSRAELLTGKDRLIMTMYLDNANTFRQLARLAGVNEVTLARRIYRITKRLLDGAYITCLYNREKLTGLEIKIARDYFLAGLAQRKIAAKRKCTRYQVLKALKKIQRIVRVESSKLISS